MLTRERQLQLIDAISGELVENDQQTAEALYHKMFEGTPTMGDFLACFQEALRLRREPSVPEAGPTGGPTKPPIGDRITT